MRIIQKEQDLAGKWRYWIEVSDNNTEMLKFQTELSDINVLAEMQNILDIRNGDAPSPNVTPLQSLDFYKTKKKQEITDAFNYTPTLGYVCSLGFLVDSTRDDLKNYQDLTDYMKANNITSVNIRINNGDLRDTTLDEIKIIVLDLIGYGLYLYQKKWDYESAIDASTTIDEVNKIVWN